MNISYLYLIYDILGDCDAIYDQYGRDNGEYRSTDKHPRRLSYRFEKRPYKDGK